MSKNTSHKHSKGIIHLRWIIELFTLALVIWLTLVNRLQLWLVVFLAGVGLSLFAGRYFCGWVCPMNTLFRLQNAVYRVLGLKRRPSPPVTSRAHIWVRGLSLAAFLGLMAAARVAHIRINPLLYLIILSFTVTLSIEEEFWHRWLCPFGTILSVTSRRAGFQVRVDQEACIGCGVCQRACPTGSIITDDGKKRRNLSHECLMCYQCVEPCPADCIGVSQGAVKG